MSTLKQIFTCSTQPASSAIKPSTAPAANLLPKANTPSIPDTQQKLPASENKSSSAKSFWQEKIKETATPSQAENQKSQRASPEKTPTETSKPLTLPKPKGTEQ